MTNQRAQDEDYEKLDERVTAIEDALGVGSSGGDGSGGGGSETVIIRLGKLEQYVGGLDEKISAKADASAVYPKADVDTKLSAKADANKVYPKGDVDTKLSAKADADKVYPKGDVDTKLNAKADADKVYTKADLDPRFTTIDGRIAALEDTEVQVKSVTPKSAKAGDTVTIVLETAPSKTPKSVTIADKLTEHFVWEQAKLTAKCKVAASTPVGHAKGVAVYDDEAGKGTRLAYASLAIDIATKS